MDPISIATVALALIATKATEKVGEKLGEGAIASAKTLLEVLRRKSPDMAKKLESGDDNLNVLDAEIIEEMRRVAAAEPEVRVAVDATFQAAQADSTTFQTLTKLADKIGVVNLGTVQNQINNITF
jgi:hypothetical protein